MEECGVVEWARRDNAWMGVVVVVVVVVIVGWYWDGYGMVMASQRS